MHCKLNYDIITLSGITIVLMHCDSDIYDDKITFLYEDYCVMGSKLYQVWLKRIYKKHNFYVGTPLDIKDDILVYLTYFKPKWITFARIIDKVSGEAVINIVNNSFSDGEYEWSASDIYHFKKYNIPLSAEFIEYFINHCKLGGVGGQ